MHWFWIGGEIDSVNIFLFCLGLLRSLTNTCFRIDAQNYEHLIFIIQLSKNFCFKKIIKLR
jgi:hypothetical protein